MQLAIAGFTKGKVSSGVVNPVALQQKSTFNGLCRQSLKWLVYAFGPKCAKPAFWAKNINRILKNIGLSSGLEFFNPKAQIFRDSLKLIPVCMIYQAGW